MSDDDLKIVAKYRQLLAKQFPATMVRHTMVKDGNDKPAILRSVFEELGDDEISKMTKSNINTIRFEIVCPVCGPFNLWEGVYSASNKGSSKTDFTKVVERFFEE